MTATRVDRLQLASAAGPLFLSGTGSPNGAVAAAQGSLFVRTDVPAIYQNTDGATAWTQLGGGASATPQCGWGLDGDVVIAGDTTLARDMFYNNLTVNVGVNLNTGGFRVFVKGTLENNGTIRNNGADAVGGAGGAGGAAGSLGGGTAGGNSSAGSGGAITTKACPSYHTISIVNLRGANGNGLPGDVRGRGGGGGGDGGVNPGGNAGNINSYTGATLGGPTPWALISGAPDRDGGATGTANSWIWGVGGGAGNNTSAGGGGGGAVVVCAHAVTGAGAFEAKGGNGSGSSGGTNGGGGGGGGGMILLMYGGGSVGSTTTSVAGGNGGAGTGGGGNGGAGAAGLATLVPLT